MLPRPLAAHSQAIAIDLGTANVLAYAQRRGIVLDEPSVVAIVADRDRSRVLAVGHEAKRMLGRTPGSIHAIRPMRDGVIADFDVAGELIEYVVRKVRQRRRLRAPRLVISVPSGATPVERRAIRTAAAASGAGKVYLIDEPMAAAVGAGCPVAEPTGSMIVDIGGGTTEVAVIALGGVVLARSIRVAGNAMDEAIKALLRRACNLLIGDETAERIKLGIGTAEPPEDGDGATMAVRGRDVATGVPAEIVISERDVAAALAEPVSAIVEIVHATLEHVPPELGADIVEHGIVLTGGGALLRRLDAVLSRATGLPVFVAEEPLTAVARGAGNALRQLRDHGALLED